MSVLEEYSDLTEIEQAGRVIDELLGYCLRCEAILISRLPRTR